MLADGDRNPQRFNRRRRRAVAPPLDDPSLYYSRELSWLEFNDRVLEEAFDEHNPLLERLKFVAICGTNLDEYFMIRVAALKQQIAAEVHKRSNDGRLPVEQIAAISASSATDRSNAFRRSLARRANFSGELQRAKVSRFVRVRVDCDDADRTCGSSKRFFEERIFPVLTPLAVDQGPSVSLYFESLAVARGRALRSRPGVEGPHPHDLRG